jgi:two-component system sensor histidine kinase ChiS
MENKTALKILIVDDDKFLLNMYAIKFKNSNFVVDAACGGDEALAKLRMGYRPDILVSDLVMPKMTGFEFLEIVKKENLKGDAVVIVLTNQGQTTDIEKAVNLNVDGYIVKATSIPSEVVEEVKNIYNKRQTTKNLIK